MPEKNVSHTKWMKRAIFLASLGRNTTSPNPRVGAVILDKNRPLRLSLSGVFSELPVPPFLVKEWRSIT